MESRAERGEGDAVFGELVIAYLFLAGVGAGGTVAACLADLLCVREPFGYAAVSFEGKPPAARLVSIVLAVSLGSLGAGAACLIADVGRADRVLALFVSPPATLMNIGAWAVALLAAVLAVLTAARFFYVPVLGRRAVVVLQVAAIILATVVAVYAGLLLGSLAGVRLWSSAWVPVLFVLSAASCGCALVFALAFFVEGDAVVDRLVDRALAVDGAVVLAELVAAAAFLGLALGSAHPGVAASVESLMHGSAALPWWMGFLLCGCVVPLAIELAFRVRARRTRAYGRPQATPAIAVALAGALIVVGALGLRTAVVEVGAHRALELQEVGNAPSLAEGEATSGEDDVVWLS